ncbi:MAG: hypothetical protein LLF76_00605 [Planctomycetaceae bacterium]|nr:hypothetical protein [Planctomycetaceae bacterium]
MKQFLFILAVLSLVLPVFSAVDTVDIAAVRQRSTASVSTADQAVITKFWRTSLDRMFLAPEPQEVVDTRLQLVEQKGGDNAVFAETYLGEALKDIQVAYETVQKIESPSKRLLIEQNLTILVAELQSPKLLPLVLDRTASEDEVVRYWAVKAITQPAIASELAKPGSSQSQVTDAVLKAVSQRAPVETRPEIARMVLLFAGSVDHPAARELLISMADKRIELYKNWTVQNEDLDVSLLNALGGVATLQSGDTKALFGRKFAELYAVILQRYLKGQGKLGPASIERLVTVIVEVDQSCLDKVMTIKTGIKTAIQRKTGLEREYETLLGNRMMAGELATKLRFDYGKDASGKAITAPPEIGALPEAVASK